MTTQEFCRIHAPALEREEARHNMILAALDPPVGCGSSNAVTWSLGSPGQCALMTPGGPILLGDVNEAQCSTLADQTAQTDYPAVAGPARTAGWFAQRATKLGVEFEEPTPQRILSLTDRPKYPGAPGRARRAAAEDAALLADWVASFNREALFQDVLPSRERLASITGEGRFFLWVLDDEPVSMGAIVRRTRRAAAISGVYTPPALRGRGYAGSVTAALVEAAFSEGKTMACLHTDSRNPFANRAYERVGFRPVCDAMHISRVRSL
jgi:RimJ/RimL family protein N-acetyltransferase